ncbi:MAG: PspC domain-containing protein [Aerococcaceae bacterium]|nr:PspC domain-containing protein [Aerococcaceae bacterium]
MKKLKRSSTDRKIAGVCGGIAEYFGIDAVIVRVLFVLLFFFSKMGPIPYIIMYFVMPRDYSNGRSFYSEHETRYERRSTERKDVTPKDNWSDF